MSEPDEQPGGGAGAGMEQQELGAVRSTRQGVEKMEVEEAKKVDIQASRQLRIKMVTAAREVWGKVRGLIVGKRILVSPETGVVEVSRKGDLPSEVSVSTALEAIGGELEDGTVEWVETEVGEDSVSVSSGTDS